MSKVSVGDVQKYWEANPLCASAVPHPLGSREFFVHYDRLREVNEPLEFSYALHEFRDFKGKRTLDVGCGNGYVLSKFALEGAEAYGVDITPTGAWLTTKRLEYLGLPGQAMVGNAESLPFPDASFDCVTSMGVLHHTPDTARAVAEIRRVLKPGGRLIVMFYHRNSAMYRLKFPLASLLTGKSMAQLVNEVDGYGNPKGDVYSRAELRRLLRGFGDFSMFAGLLQSWMLLPGGWERLLSMRALRPFERLLGWFLYCKARKLPE